MTEKPEESPIRRAAMLGLYTFAHVAIIVYSTRAVAADDYFSVLWTDVVYALLSFSVLKRLVAANTRLEKIAYIIGVVVGSQSAMYSYHLYQKLIS
jgi:hypothetical protein